MVDMTFSLVEQLPMKGRSRGEGWYYSGEDMVPYFRRTIRSVKEWARGHRRPRLASAAEIFRRTAMEREGLPSAINTYDNRRITWGVGFAGGTINRAVWPRLSEEVRRELIRLSPRIDGSGVDHRHPGIRTHRPTIKALIHVSEFEPFRDSVFKAQFAAFVEHSLGVTDLENAEQLSGDQDRSYFGSRLAHWLPAGFRMPRDLARSVKLARRNAPAWGVDDAVFLAATLKVFTANLLDGARYAEARPGGGRVLKEEYGGKWNMIRKWQNRMREFADGKLRISPGVSRIVPSFTKPAMPFFEVTTDLSTIPSGHHVLCEPGAEGEEDVVTYIDVGGKPEI